MKTIFASIFLAITLLPSLASAQATSLDNLTPALPTAGERKAADIASWATAIAAIALDARASIGKCQGQDQCYRALVTTGARVGVVYGSTFLIKKLVSRERPCASYGCGIDNPNYSLPSGHTAIAFSTIGGPGIYFALPLAIGTGGLRIAAGKHYLTDTLAGAGIGLLASRIR